jgi:hypothetical protein
VTIPDCHLPSQVRTYIREQYYKMGTVFFENFKNDYCMWSLKIIDHKRGDDAYSKDMLQNYLLAKNLMSAYKGKIVQKTIAEEKNQYFANLYRRNYKRSSINNDTLKALTEAITTTDLQIQKSTYKWIKNHIVFLNDIFFDKYLSKNVTGF